MLESGGMGVIFTAEDIERRRKVAIKTILPELKSDPAMVDLFIKECQFIQAMNHPNVVRIFEVGQKENLFFYVMDYMYGENLQKIMDREHIIPVSTALKIAIQVTRGLMHIHSNGIIHRDIKPSNIFITLDQVVKIIDFGISKLLDTKQSSADDRAGSNIYAAPEQIQGSEMTGKTDVYALGVCLFYILCGKYPFPETDMLSKLFQEPYSVKQFNPGISAILDETVKLCLEKDQDKRISIHELWARLRTISG